VFRQLKRLLFPATIHDAEAQGRGWKVTAAILIALLILAGAVSLFAVARKSSIVHVWRARRAAAKAMDHADAGNMKAAGEAYRTAWNLGASDAEAIRQLAETAYAHDPPQSVEFWKRLETLREAPLSPEEQRKLVIGLLSLGETEEAKHRTGALLRIDAYDPENWRVAARLAAAQDQVHIAEDYLNKLNAKGLADEDDLFLWNQIRGANPFLPGHEKAIQNLINYADGTGQRATVAAAVVMDHPPADETALQSLVENVLAREDTTESFRFRTIRFELNRWPGLRPRVLEREIERHRDSPPVKMVVLLDLLLEMEEYESILDLLEPHGQESLGPAVQHYCTSLSNLGRMAELEIFLAGSRTGMAGSLQSVYRAALANLRGGESEEMEAYFEVAFAEGALEAEPEHLVVAGLFAEEVGLPEVAEQGIREAIRVEENIRMGVTPGAKYAKVTTPISYRALETLARRTQQAHLLLEASEKLHEVGSGGGEYLAQAVYLRLLLGERIEESAAMAEEQATRYPSSSRWGLALAMSQHRLGAPVRIPVDQSGLRFGERMVLGALVDDYFHPTTPPERSQLYDEEQSFVLRRYTAHQER